MNLRRARRLVVGDFRLSPWRTAIASRRGRVILVGRGMRVIGAGHIRSEGRLELGLSYFGFADHRMRGLIRVRGELHAGGVVQVAVGNRWYVGEAATVRIGGGTYFSPASYLISDDEISIGSNCAIAWETQLLDSDLHSIRYGGERRGDSSGPIVIGNDVWIGSRATILKNTLIADGCVVAAAAVVRGEFSEANCLIAGVPAQVVRRNVTWGRASRPV